MATEPARNTEDKTSTLFQGSKFECAKLTFATFLVSSSGTVGNALDI